MRAHHRPAHALLVVALLVAATTVADPLASWTEGAGKRSIIDFVGRVTREGSADYLAPRERIAVFDNDGTLWIEQPMYVQFAFALDRIKTLAPL
ncbi:MAG TPA: hypothetical protein VNR40_12135, partial [Steroidobacter sp.]|nr:hypothetical protein [Steroidobacter sp.]